MRVAEVRDLSMLDKVALFNGLTPEQLSAFTQLLRFKSFPAGTTLMSVEQMGEVVYVILSGTVKVNVDHSDGVNVIISILGPGDIVGEMSLLGNMGRCANVVTLEETEVVWMDGKAFHDSLRTMPVFGYNLARILAARLRLANEQIQALSTLEVESRLARQIVAFSEQYGKPAADGGIHIPIRLTQSDIAGMVGATRERINKVMVSFKERKYISVDQNYHITVYNQKALAKRFQ